MITRLFKVAALLPLFLLAACVSVGVDPGQPLPTLDYLPDLSADATPAVQPPGAPDRESPRTTPASLLPGTGATPQAQTLLTTLAAAQARTGPGLAYDVYFDLDAGVSAPILGRSSDGDWFAIPNPGGASNPPGWLPANAVMVQGDVFMLEILPTPPRPIATPTP